jgi:predicted 2-oxoglutarate/Fe(II)-dependent dioxygenase YbiX
MRFGVGDPVPWFAADTHSTPSFQFSAAGGRLVVLSFLGSLARPESAAVLAELERHRAAFDDERLCFFGVTVDPSDLGEGRARELLPGIRWFQDFGREQSQRYGALEVQGEAVQYRPFSLLLDERLRVLACIALRPGEAHLRRLLEIALAMPAPEPAQAAVAQAPVLRVPRVFEPDFCRRLIAYYQEQGSEDSGFMRDQGGRTVGVYDYGTKRRRDCTIEHEELKRQCMLRIHRRLVPEILRAYQFDATRMERYIVACYQGEHGGHFRAHRDNTTRATAHRKFAVSLNLNDDYDGGSVWFPEYGRRLFRPAAGEAVVFSCSMLHEATSVTRGTRYVFLPFLYDDAAAKVREETRQFLGGNVNAPPEP